MADLIFLPAEPSRTRREVDFVLRRALAFAAMLALGGGCAQHRAVHTAPDESRPHITWELRTGPVEGDERFVCGSSNFAAGCELNASSVVSPSHARFHLFLHAAAKRTRYVGTASLPFLSESGQELTTRVEAVVEPGAIATGDTVAGPVTTRPGAYMVTIRLEATQDGSAVLPIEENVRVVVREPIQNR